MGLETGVVYRLVGPDGTEATFNDSADPAFVGYLDGDGGISGLDSPEVRESADVLVEANGGVHGSFYYGRRPIVLQGWVFPDEQELVNQRIERLQRASNAMRTDAELRWTETGSVERRLLVRRQQPLRLGGRRPKTFQVALVSSAAEIESSSVNSLVIDPGAPASMGVGFPISWPLDFTIPAGGQQYVVNSGNAPINPYLIITGPITNPRVLNNTTGEELRIGYEIPALTTLHVDMRYRTVLLDGVSDRYSAVEFPASVWWGLQPGNNDVRLNATAVGGGSQVEVRWRHAWI